MLLALYVRPSLLEKETNSNVRKLQGRIKKGNSISKCSTPKEAANRHGVAQIIRTPSAYQHSFGSKTNIFLNASNFTDTNSKNQAVGLVSSSTAATKASRASVSSSNSSAGQSVVFFTSSPGQLPFDGVVSGAADGTLARDDKFSLFEEGVVVPFLVGTRFQSMIPSSPYREASQSLHFLKWPFSN